MLSVSKTQKKMTEGAAKICAMKQHGSGAFWNRRTICLLIPGMILVLIGLSFLLSFDPLMNYFLKNGLQFRPQSEAYEKWMEPPVTINFDFYMFNWTNPDDIYKPNVKPRFEEVGPYRYKAVFKKANVSWNEENQTVTYQNYRLFEYDEESPRDHSDYINSINVPSLSAAYFAQSGGFLLKNGVKLALIGSPIYVQKQVRELLFEGYTDGLVSMANMFPFSSLKYMPDKFGWFYLANNTVGIDGVYNMNVKRGPHFGNLEAFNYLQDTDAFSDECAHLRYVPIGELFPTNTQPDTLTYFNPDMCRGVHLHFQRSVTIKGVPSFKFVSDEDVLDSGRFDERTKCYCRNASKCLPYGVTPTCSMDYPLYYSLPHFHRADSSYSKSVEGLDPQNGAYDIYFSVEPLTGTVTDVRTVLQFNLLLQPMPDFDTFDGVPTVLMPQFWLEQTTVLPHDVYEKLRLLYTIPAVVDVVAISSIILGIALIVVSLVYSILRIGTLNRKRIRATPRAEELPLQSKK